MTRKTNPELCAEFRKLLTDGAKQAIPEQLDVTKPWRTELWRAFKEIEARLCPRPPVDGQ